MSCIFYFLIKGRQDPNINDENVKARSDVKAQSNRSDVRA